MICVCPFPTLEVQMGFIEVTLLIILRALHHVLHLSALSLLLLYLVKCLPFAPDSFLVLCTLAFLYHFDHHFKYLASRSYPTLDPVFLAPSVCRDVICKLCIAVMSACYALNVNNDYTPGAITKLYRHFGIVFMLCLMAGTMYTALTLSRFAHCGEIIEERSRWMNVMISWSMDIVRANKFIAGGAFLLVLADFILRYADLYAVPSVIWRWATAGVAVVMLPIVFLSAISTQAALYLACRAYHQQSKVDPWILKDESPSGQV